MKKLILFCCMLQVAVIIVSAQKINFPKLTGPYLGQKPPGMIPEIFAPGLVSIPLIQESWLSFSPDGKEIYFLRGSSVSDIKRYVSKIENEIWTSPELVTFDTGYVSGNGHITFDNKRFYFNWQRPVSEGEPGYPARGGIYYTERTQNGWSEPKYTGQCHRISSTRDGQLFGTDMSSRSATGQTYFTKVVLIDGYLKISERISIEQRSMEKWGGPAHSFIAPDGSFVVFDAGGSNMFVSFKRKDGTWSEAVDLTKYGFDTKAAFPSISPDGRYLFFSLNGDHWWVDIKVIEKLRPKV